MAQPIIQVEGLGKKYLVGHQAAERERYSTLRDVVARNVRGLWNKTRDIARGRQIVQGDMVEEFWALKDINFEIQPGEVVGIIGRNGAGKSTLLKILSRITEPTEGKVTLRGRVASLLEVGTGFHPELTGRENIYLNGAILGMSREEIRGKFDEIVAFAEVEKFLDTPVKRYSSGMYVRLAFAVAAHLEPEILIVDEVLAVGDAEFQKKCLGKMYEVSSAGRTVLFVSHQLNAVKALCSRCILLSRGMVGAVGYPSEVISEYLASGTGLVPLVQLRPLSLQGKQKVVISRFSAMDCRSQSEAYSGAECRFQVSLIAVETIKRVRIAIGIDDLLGRRLFTLDTSNYQHTYELGPGENNVTCIVDSLPLTADQYKVHVYVGTEFEAYDYVNGDFVLVVREALFFPQPVSDPTHGPFLVAHQWVVASKER